jgi:hypothetical protein
LRVVGEAPGIFIQPLVFERHRELAVGAHGGLKLANPCVPTFGLAVLILWVASGALVSEEVGRWKTDDRQIGAPPVQVRERWLGWTTGSPIARLRDA